MAKGRKTGGRVKGTPNKTTEVSRAVISDFVQKYIDSGLMNEDFANLESKERVDVFIRLLKFIVPQPKEVAVEINSPNAISIEDTLIRLSKEQ